MSDKSKGVAEKFDKRIAKRIADELDKDVKAMVAELGKITRKMCKTRSVDGVMKLKTRFMTEVLSWIPLDIDTCYFCLSGKDEQDCPNCSYAGTHGRCISSGSVFRKIEDALDAARRVISKEYW